MIAMVVALALCTGNTRQTAAGNNSAIDAISAYGLGASAASAELRTHAQAPGHARVNSDQAGVCWRVSAVSSSSSVRKPPD